MPTKPNNVRGIEFNERLSCEETQLAAKWPKFWLLSSLVDSSYAIPLSMVYSQADKKFYCHTTQGVNGFYQRVRTSPQVRVLLRGWRGRASRDMLWVSDRCHKPSLLSQVVIHCTTRITEVTDTKRKEVILTRICEHYFPNASWQDIHRYYESVVEDLRVWEIDATSLQGVAYRKDEYFQHLKRSPRTRPHFDLRPSRAFFIGRKA